MAAGQGQSNPALVTQDEMAMHYKHKYVKWLHIIWYDSYELFRTFLQI